MSETVDHKNLNDNLTDELSSAGGDLEEYVVRINRCSKVVKGGRRLSFSAVVVVGDRCGRIGVGLGKANEVADAIRKGGEIARKSLFSVKLEGRTIPHEALGEFCGAKVLLRPAVDGTGIIAGGGARAVLNLSGVHNILAKSLGSNNKWNVVHATIAALKMLRSREECAAMRGVNLSGSKQPEEESAATAT